MQSEVRVQRAGVSDGTDEASSLLPSGSAQAPVSGVFVSYDEFNTRRQLLQRVMAAFEKLEQEGTLGGETLRAVTRVQGLAGGDEIGVKLDGTEPREGAGPRDLDLTGVD
jgi:hypothetical protein